MKMKHLNIVLIYRISLIGDVFIRKCEICKKEFKPNRPWQKYCSPKCNRKGKVENAKAWRHKHSITIESLSDFEIKKKDIYENVISALKESKKISWSQLYEKSGINDKTLFDRYIKTFYDRGIIEKQNHNYLLSKRYIFEPLRIRQKNIIMDTPLQYPLFRPPGFNFTYYSLFDSSRFKSIVTNFDERMEKIEKKLQKADSEWMTILAEARNNYVKNIWNQNILIKKNIGVLTKFAFALDLIFKIRENNLIWVAPPHRSINDQLDLFDEITEKAFYAYIQHNYPTLTKSKIGKLKSLIDKEYASKESFFEKVRNKILLMENPDIFEHIIVIDLPFIGTRLHNELVKEKIINQISFDRDKPIGEQLEKLKILSEKQSYYQENEEKSLQNSKIKKIIKDELVIKTPFFKDFFKTYENELFKLGFKKGKSGGGLDSYYQELDEAANNIRMPSLPEKSDLLFIRGA
jgi:hypothetical protein